MTDIDNKYLRFEIDLKNSFKEFFLFSFELLKEVDKNNNKLKFAVVNMQIALELFLKYYFIKQKKYDWLFASEKKLVFKDFSQILNKFYHKDSELLVTQKEHLKSILDARNKIVHEGKQHLDKTIIVNLINTTLFIQNVLNREFNETLLDTSFFPHDNGLSSNLLWRKGAENFAQNLAKLNNKEVYECWFCFSNSFLDKKIFTCDELDDEGFQCATCLNTFYLHHQIELAKCICGDKTFILDPLNPQNEIEYNGKCLKM